MKYRVFIFSVLSTLGLAAQIDYTKTIIGRNNGIHQLHDGNQTRIFGFTESLGAATKIPGPIIDINSGDSVKIDFFNLSQGAPHTIHLHGLDVDQQNDGVGMLSFEVEHDQHGYYYFKAPHPGTYLYHCHVGSTIHLQAGMYGLCIVRPSNGDHQLNWDGGETYGRDFALLASEIDTVWHNDTILDHEHDMTMPLYVPENFTPQYFLVNGKSGSQLTDPSGYLYALQNEKVYMRLANIGYYGVRFIFPAGLNARTVSSDGRPLPTEVLSDTVEVFPGERYETFLQLGTQQFNPFIVEHFNLNTQVVESSQTMTIQTTLADITSIELTDLTIYPNPSGGIFYFSEVPSNGYEVLDLQGKSLFKAFNQEIDLTNFDSGIYFVKTEQRIYKIIRD